MITSTIQNLKTKVREHKTNTVNNYIKEFPNQEKIKTLMLQKGNEVETLGDTYDFIVVTKPKTDMYNIEKLLNKHGKIIVYKGRDSLDIIKQLLSANYKKIYNNLVFEVYKKEDTAQDRLEVWNGFYEKYLEELYKGGTVKYLFDFGHRYLANVDKKKGIVLDFGCGSGYHYAFEDINNTKKYILMDSNVNTIEQLKKSYPDVILTNGKEIPLEDASVDYLICSHILEHIHDITDILKEFNRVLKQGGELLLVAPCDPGTLWNLTTKISPNRNRLKKVGLDYTEVMAHEHVTSIDTVKKEVDNIFSKLEETYFPFKWIKNPNLNLMLFGRYIKN